MNKQKYSLSSGNVFADIGLPDAEELQAKADLAIQISRAIERHHLTQTEAAEMLGIDQPKISALVRGRLTGFSMERLYRFLNALGSDIEIIVRPAARSRKKGHVRVLTATCEIAVRLGSAKEAPSAAKGRAANRTKQTSKKS
jgi:predicted XRE-type DNA-binding protein